MGVVLTTFDIHDIANPILIRSYSIDDLFSSWNNQQHKTKANKLPIINMTSQSNLHLCDSFAADTLSFEYSLVNSSELIHLHFSTSEDKLNFKSQTVVSQKKQTNEARIVDGCLYVFD